MTTYIVNKPFGYAGKHYEAGEEIKPTGAKWDYKIFDPEYKYVRIENPKLKVKKKEDYECDYCDRTFTTPQGKAAHMRFCKQKE